MVMDRLHSGYTGIGRTQLETFAAVLLRTYTRGFVLIIVLAGLIEVAHRGQGMEHGQLEINIYMKQ